ncbi:3-carboxy-cis,cis-muconate cycloisomerase [Hyphomicrobium zavarzinii]|uniref:3-carboxy-cis,cis-muconate cycloisomerase n=1 Tax=Hyphomicrobium zavarzinii TaxID=48292 RepID=UPI00037F709E|nr:3-carboxy-cis,cis-muconate cycloisomerase [Hyphomicrobium zavarzinii]
MRSHDARHHLGKLLGDDEIERIVSSEADIGAILRFEAALATAQSIHAMIPVDAALAIGKACDEFDADATKLRDQTAIDGVVVPALVAQLKSCLSQDIQRFVHVGATSQDAIDTSLMLRLKQIALVYGRRLDDLLSQLAIVCGDHGHKPVMARTRMRDAKSITLKDRLVGWQQPLQRLRQQLGSLQDTGFLLQLGGPVGTFGTSDKNERNVASTLAELLHLCLPERPWHTARWPVVEIANWMSTLTGCLGKLGQDVLIMSQDSISDVRLEGAGSSSSMPHKQNPVKGEVLVALADYNATLVGGMHRALMAENERSGSMWTLEWLILPEMTVATGCSLRTAVELLKDADLSRPASAVSVPSGGREQPVSGGR